MLYPGTGGYSISPLSLAFRGTSVSPVNLHIIDNCSRQVSDLYLHYSIDGEGFREFP